MTVQELSDRLLELISEGNGGWNCQHLDGVVYRDVDRLAVFETEQEVALVSNA